MKILYIVNHVDWFWSHRFTLAKAAKDSGYDVYVAVPHADGQFETFEKHGFHLISLHNKGLLQSAPVIRSLIRSLLPDIVHAITLKQSFITAIATFGLKRQPFLCYTIAGLGYLFSHFDRVAQLKRTLLTPFFRFVFKHGVFMFQNDTDMQDFLNLRLVRDHQCVRVPGSGVNTSKYTYVPEAHTESPLVLFPARLLIEKGIYDFVTAAKIVHAHYQNARFEIVGDITSAPNAISRQALEALITDTPVRWLGKIGDMHEKLIETNVVVYPSYYREGVPKALLEAMATGRVIVTTDNVGCRDAIHHDRNGLLVPIRDPDALAEAMMTLINDPAKRIAMGKAGRKMAEDVFDVDIVIKKTLALYAMANTASISTATLNGNDGAPTANLAWRPASPIT